MADPHTATKHQFVDAALRALTTMDHLMAGAGQAKQKISPSEMHAYAVNPSVQASPKLLHALKNDPDIQTDFRRLLDNTARYHLPQVAAASSGDITSRDSAGCKISFRPSRADDHQMYVIIECIGDVTFSPEILFVYTATGDTERQKLPPAHNGRIQLLLDRESGIAKGLLDINSEVYLK